MLQANAWPRRRPRRGDRRRHRGIIACRPVVACRPAHQRGGVLLEVADEGLVDGPGIMEVLREVGVQVRRARGEGDEAHAVLLHQVLHARAGADELVVQRVGPALQDLRLHHGDDALEILAASPERVWRQEVRVVLVDQPPLGEGVRLAVRPGERVQRFVLWARKLALLAVKVVADDLEVAVAGVEALGRVPFHSGLSASERVPDNTQLRGRIDCEVGIAADERRKAKATKGGVERRPRPTVEDEVHACERLSVGVRRVGGSFRGAVLAIASVEAAEVVHLRHQPEVNEALVHRDPLVQRDQERVPASLRDVERLDCLREATGPAGPDVHHRDRPQACRACTSA